MKKQILSEQFRRMQKLAGIITESETESETAGIGDLYKLFKYKDNIKYILTQSDMKLKINAGKRLVTAYGGLYEAKLIMLGAIKSIDSMTLFIKPLLPNNPKPLNISKANELFAAMGFSSTTIKTFIDAIRVVCKDLGVTVKD
jgi:hypothetical protein